MTSTGLLEIGAVARELGVSPSTLRTWERRYRSVVPQRGEHGQRLYDSEQVVMLRRVLAQVRRGSRAGAAHENALAPRPLRILRIQPKVSPEAPMEAREAVDTLLEDRGDARFSFYLRLVVNELVKNAVLYGAEREPIRIELKLFEDWVDLCVRNGGPRLSMKSLRTRRREGGRGLEIIDALAEAWSIDTGPFGTTVTVRLPVEARV